MHAMVIAVRFNWGSDIGEIAGHTRTVVSSNIGNFTVIIDERKTRQKMLPTEFHNHVSRIDALT